MRFIRGLRGREVPVLGLLLCFLAMSIPALGQGLENRLETTEERKQKAQARANEFAAKATRLSRKVAAIDAVASRIQGEVNDLDRKMDRLNGRIDVVERDLTAAQIRLNFLTRELQGILSKLDRRTDLFTERAVAAYMAGPTSHLEGLLSATTFNEVVDRTSYYESALDADSKLVSEIELLRDGTEIKRDQVQEEEEAIAAKKLQLEADKAQLEADADRIQAILTARSTGAGVLPVGGGQLLWPANGPLTSGYGYRTHPIFGDGRMHTGIDIGAAYGAPVIAADAGVVAYVGTMSGYGNVIVVDHGGGLATTYNHLSAFGVSSGQSVGRGVPIGNVGCTGYCTGPHLHFEVRINGSPVDPMPYLQ